MEASSSTSTRTMNIKTKSWARTLKMKVWTKGRDYALIRVLEGGPRETGMMTLKRQKQLWNYLPQAGRVMKLPSGMLGDSGITEGAPGILVLDEFQRFRTMDRKGEDVKVERYQDVWTLLSDGRLPPALSALSNIERKLAEARAAAERAAEAAARAADRLREDAVGIIAVGRERASRGVRPRPAVARQLGRAGP